MKPLTRLYAELESSTRFYVECQFPKLGIEAKERLVALYVKQSLESVLMRLSLTDSQFEELQGLIERELVNYEMVKAA